MKKFCKNCQAEKDVNEDNFCHLSRSSDGFDYYCKPCRNKRALSRYYSEKNSELRRGNLNRAYRYKYGITRDEKQKLFESQESKCACCGSRDSGNRNGWSLDHDHITGEVRGVVCHSCNVALGAVKDSILHLELLITYMKAHQPLVMKAVA